MKKLCVVGNGISAIMTAYFGIMQGLTVEVVSRNGDPRKKGNHLDGSSLLGENTRFVTSFEGHPYLGSTAMYPEMRNAFMYPVSEGGWLGKTLNSFSEEEKKWLKKRSIVNNNESFFKDSFDFYARANLASMKIWDSLQNTRPELFHGTNIRKDILRLYDGEDLFSWANVLHRRWGVLKQRYDINSLIKKFPYLEKGVESGFIKGGLLIEGFSFDLKNFICTMMSFLEQQGCTFLFEKEVKAIRFKDNEVYCLEINSGFLYADHYSLHIGAYGNDLVNSLPLHSNLYGVTGRWLFADAPKDLSHSIKVHGGKHFVGLVERPIVDLNIAYLNSHSQLLVGGGYAFVGKDHHGLNTKEKEVIDEENKRVLNLVLPNQTVSPSEKECTRSWTYDDLPLFESFPTKKGGRFIVVGGTNTGTTTFAPIEAEMILALLHSNEHLLLSAHMRLKLLSKRICKEL